MKESRASRGCSRCCWGSAPDAPAIAAAPSRRGSEAASLAARRPGGLELLIEGAQVFGERCSPCHGDAGRGDGILADVLPIRPRNYLSEPFKWGREPAEIVETIRLGRSDVMPSFEGALSAREMEAVANLVSCWVAKRQAAK